MVKNLPTMQEIQVQFLGRENPLEKGMAIHSSILAWRISMEFASPVVVYSLSSCTWCKALGFRDGQDGLYCSKTLMLSVGLCLERFVFFFFLIFIYLLTALGLYCSIQALRCCAWTLSSCCERGLLSSCGLWVSHWAGFSCCRTWALELGLSSCCYIVGL